MTFEELQLICELPNYSSFADASYYVPYSPAAITKYVNNVENELGVKLFVRSSKSRSLSLTEEGKAVLESLKRINDDFSYLKKQISQLKNQDNARLRIGSQPRFGNIHEQKIIAAYLLEYPSSQVSMHKHPADELIRGLIAGNIDAAMITINKDVPIDKYLGDGKAKIVATLIAPEPDMFAGVSDEWFPGRSEISLKELEDFTLAFPFPASNDQQSAQALSSWQAIAKQKDIHLKYLNIQAYDPAVFEIAVARKYAVTASHIPTVSYPGIHFVRISDWNGGNNLYLVKRSGSSFDALKQFEEVAANYSAALTVNHSH